MPDFSFEEKYKGIIAGVDEAGRGPWAGPVVAAAVILNPEKIPDGLNDSKKIKPKKREVLYEEIRKTSIFGIGIVPEGVIDEINILEATKLAMKQAVENLSRQPDIALIDGNHAPLLVCQTETIIGGDGKSFSIAAASIMAKVTRDRIMRELHYNFPDYGWDRNSGYGTKEHQESLAQFGVTPHHRQSFAPIKKLVKIL